MKLPVGNQIRGCRRERGVLVRVDFHRGAHIIEQTDVVQGAIKEFLRFEAAADGILLQAEHQCPAGWNGLSGGKACPAVDQGATAIVSLHDVNLAARFADRCLLLFGDGRWQLGDVADVLNEASLSELYATQMEAVAWRDQTLYVPASGHPAP